MRLIKDYLSKKMELSFDNIKIMVINKRKEDISGTEITYKGQTIEVAEFEYMRTVITNDGKIETELANRGRETWLWRIKEIGSSRGETIKEMRKYQEIRENGKIDLK